MGEKASPAGVQRGDGCWVLWGREAPQGLPSHWDVREENKGKIRKEFSSRRN